MRLAPVQKIKRGEFVKRKPESKRVYIRREYDPTFKVYSLQAFDDINFYIYVKRGVALAYDFEF